MLIDLSVKVTRQADKDAHGNEKQVSFGHLGTHFDVMDKEFPLAFTRREGIAFDVSDVEGRDIGTRDVDLAPVEAGMFAAFRTGFIERESYGTRAYFTGHPQLSDALIDALLEKGVSIIGVDCAGVRRGGEHTPKDQYCADRGVFIIENLCNLGELLGGEKTARFVARTFPVNFDGMTGLPCRVVAEVDDG
ncbi:cyclase family protein [Anaerotruncus massiliensis (ex Togo et al. 2019)]|uniref:cyclase family protein n=1 Tax=Anaerotruncus massiliensis (ex Togo et al. 2019) TaxID=1673720 RepID=UPI0023F25686|nr:cyclase family protein [Anaerotruncus massiliensis (ex Togo et al. 2019)]